MIRINKIKAAMMVAGAVATVSALPMASYAQDDNYALEEVTVTARKRAESLQEVPVAVTAITGQLENSAVRNLKDLQNFVPNVSIDSTPASSAASISIRGISFQEPDKSLDPPVGVILDGVYLGTAAGQLMDSFDLERVEVLRGPQGTLFGKNTIAGAVNVIRSAPTKEFGLKAKVGLGDFGQQEVKAVVNTPLGSAGGLKVYANKSESDGYIKNNIVGRSIGGDDFEQFGATAAFDVTDNFDLSVTAERIKDGKDMGAFSNFNDATTVPCLISLGYLDGANSGPYTGVPGAGCMALDTQSGENNSSMNTPNDASVTNDFASLTMNWTLGDWTLTSITGQVDRDEDFDLEYDSSSVEFLTVTGASTYEQFSQELRINGRLNEAVHLTAGVYYWDSKFTQTQTGSELWGWIAPFPTDTIQVLNNKGSNTASAVFASLDWAITDSWSLNLGGRYTQEEKTFSAAAAGFISPTYGVLVPDGPVQHFDDKWNEFSPRLALQYMVDDDLMFFGSYSSGFKSGGYFARSTIPDANSYDPETVDTAELGMKSQWLNDRLRLNATAFFTDYDDKQEEVIIQDGLTANTVVRNASTVEIKGLELEFAAQVTGAISMYANLGLLDSNYTDFMADINGDGIATDNSGLKLRNAPETTFSIGGEFVQPFSFGELSVNYNYRWADEYQTVFNNHDLGLVDAIGMHNASITMDFADNYRVSVYGRNLTDERYARVVIIPGFTHFGQYNAPRTYGAELVVDF